MITYYIYLIVLFFFAGCTSGIEKKGLPADSSITLQKDSILRETEKNPPVTPPSSVIKDSSLLDKWRIYTDLYGTNYSNDKNELLILDGNDERTSYDGYKHIVLDSILYFRAASGEEMALAVLYTNVYPEEGIRLDCHSCGAPLALALYQHSRENIWRLRKQNLYVDSYGCWGLLSEYSLQPVPFDLPMLIVQPGFTGQGYTYSNDVFIFLPDLEPCLSLDTHEDNAGAVAENDPALYSWDATYQWQKKDSTTWLEVTARSNGPVEKAVGKTIYRWNKKTRKLEKQ